MKKIILKFYIRIVYNSMKVHTQAEEYVLKFPPIAQSLSPLYINFLYLITPLSLLAQFLCLRRMAYLLTRQSMSLLKLVDTRVLERRREYLKRVDTRVLERRREKTKNNCMFNSQEYRQDRPQGSKNKHLRT